jgi:polar amino acid transport system substrate-binding protein
MDGRYTSVRQAIGTKPENTALKAIVEQFIAEAKESGLVAGLLEKHGVKGKLQVAPGS